MPDGPREGRTASREYVVAAADDATALGSGDVPVLATPRLVAWLEAATVDAVAPDLGPGRTTVGVRVEVAHRRATPVGARVVVSAEVVEADGRSVRFAVAARHEVVGAGGEPVEEAIADGTVVRAVVDRGRFVDRLPRPAGPPAAS